MGIPSPITGVTATPGNGQATVSWPALYTAARTQRIAWSQNMTQTSAGGTSNSNWIQNLVTAAANAAQAPDGSLTANLLTFSAGGADIYQNRPCAGSTVYTFYVTLFTASGTYVLSLARNNAITWTGGAFVAITVTTTPTRYALTWTTGPGDVQNEVLIGANQVPGSTVTSVAAGTVYAVDAQLETGTATDYMRNDGNADLVVPAITRAFVRTFPGGAYKLQSSPTNTSDTVTGLSNGTPYTFTVVGINADGIAESDPSTVVTPAAPPTAPDAPAGVVAIGADGTAIVCWGVPASDGGSALTGYYVTISPSAPGFPQTLTAADFSVSVFGLTNDVTYTASVVAQNAIGDSAPATGTFTPSVPIAPRTPAGVGVQTNASTISPAVFGLDFDFLNGLNPSMPLVGGFYNLGQALVHRYQTPRGGLFYDPDYGTDLRDYLNAPMTSSTLSQLVGDAQSEALKDERIQTCTASPSFDRQSSTLSLSMSGLTSSGPFAFIFSVTNATVALLSAQSIG